MDVANVLGIIGTQTITDRLDEDEVGFTLVIDALGREQKTSIISESGVYAAIGRSNKPAAKDFQRWLRKDVVPSIRKYGGTYSMSAPKSLMEALRALLRQKAPLSCVEDAARGLGFTQEKNGVQYVLWWRVNQYLQEIGYSTQVWKDDFIPDWVFWRLAMKASNAAAAALRTKVTDKILPTDFGASLDFLNKLRN